MLLSCVFSLAVLGIFQSNCVDAVAIQAETPSPGPDDILDGLARLFEQNLTVDPQPRNGFDRGELSGMNVKKLKTICRKLKLDTSRCVMKKDLVDLLMTAQVSSPTAVPLHAPGGGRDAGTATTPDAYVKPVILLATEEFRKRVGALSAETGGEFKMCLDVLSNLVAGSVGYKSNYISIFINE